MYLATWQPGNLAYPDVEKVFDVTFLPGALSPVTASNGGAGGVFLDGTGGSFFSTSTTWE